MKGVELKTRTFLIWVNHSLRPKQDGTGLGLMVTNQIIKDHNGEIKIESSLEKEQR